MNSRKRDSERQLCNNKQSGVRSGTREEKGASAVMNCYTKVGRDCVSIHFSRPWKGSKEVVSNQGDNVRSIVSCEG